MNLTTLQGYGIRVLNEVAQSTWIDRMGLRKPLERSLYHGSKRGFQLAGAVARQFKPARGGQATRLPGAPRSDLFDLSLSDEQQMVRDAVQRFATEVLRPLAAAADADVRLPSDLRTQAAELGLSYYAVPESLGGAAVEASTVTQVIAAEELAKGDFTLAAALLAPLGVANALTRWGTAAQQATYLPAFASDQPPVATCAVTEPTPLFDPAELSTRAERVGSQWVLTGEKSLVLLGLEAELILVAAAVEGRPRVFVVPGGTAGMSWRDEEAMGLKAAQTMRLRLDQVHLPEDALLGDDDFDYNAFLDFGALAWCALAVGTCQAVLEHVVPYVNERVAFGEPIAHRQGVAFMVADMAIEIDAMRLLTWQAASRAEAGEDFHREAYLARLLCAQKAMKIGTDGVQLLGGHGFTKEYPVERWYRDLRFVAIAHGGLHV